MTSGHRKGRGYNDTTLFSTPIRAALLLAIAGLAGPGTPARGAESEPPLDQLVEINAEALIGAETAVKTDLGVAFNFRERRGIFNKVFQARGPKAFISKLEEAKDAGPGPRLLGGAEDVFSLLCVEGGTAQSNFELEGDWKISFKAKVQNLAPASSLAFRVNQDGKSYIQTSFFHDLLIVDGGKKKPKITPIKELQGEPFRWFDQKTEKGVDIEIEFKEKKLTIFMHLKKEGEGRGEGKGRGDGRRRGWKGKESEGADRERIEIISQENIEKPAKGKVVIAFQKLSFLLGDFKIEGKLSRSWAEEGIAKLRKDGKLKLKKEEKPAPAAVASGDPKARKGESATKKASLDDPDPEAEEDL